MECEPCSYSYQIKDLKPEHDLYNIPNFFAILSLGILNKRILTSLTSWREGASLALAGHPSSDGVTIKMPFRVDVLHQPTLYLIFSYWVG